MPLPIPSDQMSPFAGLRRRAAPEAVRTSSQSDGAATCLSPERAVSSASPPSARPEHRRYERGHVEQVTRDEGAQSPRSARSPGRDMHASDEIAHVLSPEAQRPSSPTASRRRSPAHHRYEKAHYSELASSAECPERAAGDGAAGGSSSNHHVLTRFHNGESGGDRLHHVAEVQRATKTEDGLFRQQKATRSPGRRRLTPPGEADPTSAKQAGAIPRFIGEKVAETADGWAAYREPRPGGGVEVTWRRVATPEDASFSTSHRSLSLAEVVSGTGDGCISSFNVGAPKWIQEGKGDHSRLQMSSFSKHRIGEASGQDSSTPRSVFARRRAAAEELEYDDWHRIQSRQTKAAVRGPPPTPQQWLQNKIQEAKTIPAVASILEPRELEEFMHQLAESSIDELEVHNHEFSDKIRRGNCVPQELHAWKFLQGFAQGCIQREVAKLDVIARANTESAPQTPPQTPLASQFKDLDSSTALAIDGIDAAYAIQTPEQQYNVATPVAEGPVRNASTVAETPSAQTSEQVTIAEVPDKAARKEMFIRMDAHSTGKLTLDQILRGVEQSYPHLNHRPALLRAYRAADVNGDGLIGRREFRLLLEYLVYFSEVWQDFEAFGHDDKRPLSKSDFIACCEQLSLLSAQEAGEEFHVVDKDAGGYVLFETFCCWAGIHKIGTTKQLWPKYKVEPEVASEPAYVDFDSVLEQPEPRRNRHARVVSPDKGGRLSKPNRIWVNNKWQDSPSAQTTAMVGMDRTAALLTSTPRPARLGSPVRASLHRAAADSTGTSLLTSPELQKPSHLLSSPERRTLRNRESARQVPGSYDEIPGADASLAVSLTGVWRATGERRDGTKVQQAIYIRQEQDGRVTGGHVDGVNGFFVIKDGTVDGSTVWFRQEYSNGNRVVWEATIEPTHVNGTSGIMVPKLVDGTWKGSNLQGSFSASWVRLTPAEVTGSVVTMPRKRGKTAALAAGASTKQPARQAQAPPSRPHADQADVVADAVPETPTQSALSASPLSSTSASTQGEDLSGMWVAVGQTEDGAQEEQFVLEHDVRSGGLHGRSIQQDGDDSFDIIQGEVENGSVKFVQKFNDGAETLWEASVQHNSLGTIGLVEGTWRLAAGGNDVYIAGTFTAQRLPKGAYPLTTYPRTKSLLSDGLQPEPEPEPEPEPQSQPQPQPQLQPQLDSRARQRAIAENAKAIIETPKRKPAATAPLRQRHEPAQGVTKSGGGGTRAKSPFLRKGSGAGGAGSLAASRYSKRSPSPTSRATPAGASLSAQSRARSRGPASVRTPPAGTNGKNRPLSARRTSGQKSSTPRAGSPSGKRVKEATQLRLSDLELQLLKQAEQEGLDRSDLM